MKPEIKCKHCNGKNLIKKGKQKTKFGFSQAFYCKDCRKKFSDRKTSNKTYPSKIIINALNYYNTGHTIEQTAKLISRQFKVKISKSTTHSWIKEFREICDYSRIRKENTKKYGTDVLVAKSFKHNGLAYNFRYHKAKLEKCKFSSLISYIQKFKRGCPDFFDKIENRCSQLKINIQIKKENKENPLCRLASLALKACSKNNERHTYVENLVLINDARTVACELPIWLWEKNLDTGISGHIDLLQVRNGLIYILDYKPNALRENEQKVASQLWLYASGLSFRTKIKLDKFRCAWFDEKNYFEFNPKSAKVRFRKSRR